MPGTGMSNVKIISIKSSAPVLAHY